MSIGVKSKRQVFFQMFDEIRPNINKVVALRSHVFKVNWRKTCGKLKQYLKNSTENFIPNFAHTVKFN